MKPILFTESHPMQITFSSGRFIASLLVVFIYCAVNVAVAQEDSDDGGEQLLFVQPKGWHEVYADAEANLSTTEYVPVAQSADDWEEMLTVQVVVGLKDADPEVLLSNVAEHLEGECAEFDLKPIELAGVGDYPTLGVMIMCGRKKASVHGEFTLLRGIAGKENFYLLQKSWRTDQFNPAEDTPVELDDRKFWLGYLAYLTICDPALKNCPKRLAPE